MKMRKMAAALHCAAVLAVAFPEAGAAQGSAHKTYTIVMEKMTFGSSPSGLRKGDSIRWINRDLFRHSASAKDHSFDIDLPPGQSAVTILKRPGTIVFFCKYHPGMKGTLTVAS